jgi:hypothetical protein
MSCNSKNLWKLTPGISINSFEKIAFSQSLILLWKLQLTFPWIESLENYKILVDKSVQEPCRGRSRKAGHHIKIDSQLQRCIQIPKFHGQFWSFHAIYVHDLTWIRDNAHENSRLVTAFNHFIQEESHLNWWQNKFTHQKHRFWA